MYIDIKNDGTLSIRNFSLVIRSRSKGLQLGYTINCRGAQTATGKNHRIDEIIKGFDLKETLVNIGQSWSDIHKSYYKLTDAELTNFMNEIQSEPVINAFQALIVNRLERKGVSVSEIEEKVFAQKYSGKQFYLTLKTPSSATNTLTLKCQYLNRSHRFVNKSFPLSSPDNLIKSCNSLLSLMKHEHKKTSKDPEFIDILTEELQSYLVTMTSILKIRNLYDSNVSNYISSLECD